MYVSTIVEVAAHEYYRTFVVPVLFVSLVSVGLT